jgi:hypothetical protein
MQEALGISILLFFWKEVKNGRMGFTLAYYGYLADYSLPKTSGRRQEKWKESSKCAEPGKWLPKNSAPSTRRRRPRKK